MNTQNVIENLKGVIPFIPTPFIQEINKPFTKLDGEGLKTNLRYLTKYDFSCIAPVAGTGDLLSLTDSEYETILEITMEEVGDRFLLMPGLPQETERAIKAARHAQKMGYACVLSFPPPTLNLSEEGLFLHWKEIASAVNLFIVVFRAPWLPFQMTLLERLKDIPNIMSVKEETGDVLWFRNAKLKYGDRFTFIGGGELQFPNYLLAGAAAITTGLPNFMPEPFFEMYRLAEENNYRKVMEIHETLLPLLTLRQKQGNTIPLLKYAMELVGLVGGVNRLPQVELSEEDKALTRSYLKKLNLILQS